MLHDSVQSELHRLFVTDGFAFTNDFIVTDDVTFTSKLQIYRQVTDDFIVTDKLQMASHLQASYR